MRWLLILLVIFHHVSKSRMTRRCTPLTVLAEARPEKRRPRVLRKSCRILKCNFYTLSAYRRRCTQSFSPLNLEKCIFCSCRYVHNCDNTINNKNPHCHLGDPKHTHEVYKCHSLIARDADFCNNVLDFVRSQLIFYVDGIEKTIQILPQILPADTFIVICCILRWGDIQRGNCVR